MTTANPETVPLMTLSLLPEDRKIHKDENLVDTSNPRVYFVNENGIYMSVFRDVVCKTKVIKVRNTGRMKIVCNLPPLHIPESDFKPTDNLLVSSKQNMTRK